MRSSSLVRLFAVAPLAVLLWVGVAAAPASAVASPLVGTFSISPGSCSGGVATGTYLRMVLSGGTNASGPYFSNSDSSCPDNTYTLLSPGTAGGLVTGSYQPEPSPAFDGQGNAMANQITRPVAFEGVKFATATNAVDPQTGQHVAAPVIEATGSTLSGNLESFGVSWNNQQFNQGSPKPGGVTPGNTTPVTGTYNASNGSYTLQWSSQVVGGPFNGFSAFWYLTGTFTPSGGPATPAPTPTSSVPATTGATSPLVSPDAKASPGAVAPAVTAPSSGTTTSTTSAPAAGTSGKSHRSEHVVLTSHTTSTGSSGWNTPTWLIVLIGVLAALGLFGVVWSERNLRRQGVSP